MIIGVQDIYYSNNMLLTYLSAVYLLVYFLATTWSLIQMRKALKYSRTLKKCSKEPDVTIIRPIHGANSYTEQCLLSWLSQVYSGKTQHILSFQDQNDDALQIARRLQSQYDIEILINPILQGYSGKTSNIHFALQNAKYENLILSDGDIVAPPDSLSKIAYQMERFDIISCITVHTQPKNIWAKVYTSVWNSITVSLVPSAILNKWFPALAGGTIGIKKKNLEQIGGIGAIANYIAEDGALAIFAAQNKLTMGLGPIVTSPVGAISFYNLWHKLLRGSLTALKMNPNGIIATLLFYTFLFSFWFFIIVAAIKGNGLALAASVSILLIRLFQTSYVASLSSKKISVTFEILCIDLLSICAFIVAACRPYVYWGPIKFKVLKNGRLERCSQ